jgi:uncharacterized protein (DUF1330 family)
MGSILPTAERITEFAALPQNDGPIVMLNLLRYRKQAEYPAGSDFAPCSGREAYDRYSAVAVQKVASVGGRILWFGQSFLTFIGPDDEIWDDAVLAQYPSRQAFLDMVAMPDYQAASVHRTAALADSRLIGTKTLISAMSNER